MVNIKSDERYAYLVFRYKVYSIYILFCFLHPKIKEKKKMQNNNVAAIELFFFWGEILNKYNNKIAVKAKRITLFILFIRTFFSS